MEQPTFDPGLTQRFTGTLRRAINKDGSFNVHRSGTTWRDVHPYLYLINTSWWSFFSLMFVGYVVMNTLFALVYYSLGPNQLQGADAPTEWNHFLNSFFFSAHTLTTVGYGSISPKGTAANVVASIEAMVGLMGFALATGLLYGRVSRPSARIGYSPNVLIAPYQEGDISLEDDGDYYTWTLEEASRVLPPDELEAIRQTYHLDGQGEMHLDPRRHVLYIDKEPDVVAALLDRSIEEVRRLVVRGRARLGEARAARPAPFVDRTIYAGWNGMMISAFFDATRALDRADVQEAALRALDRVLQDAYEPGQGFRHVVSAPGGVTGLLDDQVHMARALLAAYEQTGERRYLCTAEETMTYVLDEFVDPAGAFYDRARNAAAERHPLGLDLPHIPIQDAPTPAGNGVAVLVLDRLSMITGTPRYRDAAERALRACAPGNMGHGLFTATVALALDQHLNPPLHVVVVGRRGDVRTRTLHSAALLTYRPGATVHVHDPSSPDGTLPAIVAAQEALGEGPRAYVCSATACAAPVTTPDALRGAIQTFGRASAT
jgi:uncharacterized protein YyaL (SSP411 family)